MTRRAESCPFCGEDLIPLGGEDAMLFQHPYTDGPDKRACFLLAVCKETIHINQLDLWNERVEYDIPVPTAPPPPPGAEPRPLCHYTIREGLPEFNSEGRGTPATLKFLNDCFDYIRGQTNG